MKKKVVLFFPAPFPYRRPWKGVPLSLLAISRVLDKEKYEVKIISRFLNDNPEKEILAEAKDGLCLGITAMTGFQIYDGLKMAMLVKRANPDLPIIWGGWHPSILPKQTLKNKYVDIVVRGQGDWTFPELVSCLEKSLDLEKVAGIGYKKNNKIIFTNERPLQDINNLPPLPYHLVDVEKCIIGTEYGQRTLPYISSYGCPFHCGFCVEQIVNRGHWIGLEAEKVVSEWEELVKKYKVDSIAVYDSNFFVDKKRVYDICAGLLKKRIKIKWGNANGRIPQLVKYEPEIWEVMKKSGCSMILTGAESGSQIALDLIKKDMKVDEIIQFTKLCQKYQIKILFSFLVGLPWSNKPLENSKFVKEEYKTTLSLIDKLLRICKNNRFTYYLFLPYPGAPLFNRAVKLGLKTPFTLNGWSTYLISPEDAFKTVVKQKWIPLKQAKEVAMLTQYVFGLIDPTYYQVLRSRVSGKINKYLFSIAYKIGRMLVGVRWRFKYFGLPIDYGIFVYFHKYGGLV